MRIQDEAGGGIWELLRDDDAAVTAIKFLMPVPGENKRRLTTVVLKPELNRLWASRLVPGSGVQGASL